MADRLTEKKEAAKKDEAYQPLWDTDQSIPEYMALLMGEQTQKNEDVELHEASDSEDSDGSNEPEDTSEDTPEDTHESRKDDEANHPVALASTEQAQQEHQLWQAAQDEAYAKADEITAEVEARMTSNRQRASEANQVIEARLNPPHPCRRAPPT